MPEPVRKTRDPIRPLLGAATCAFFYWFALNLIVPAGRFLGGEMIAMTVPPLVAAAIASALAMAIFESRSFGDLGLAWQHGTRRNLLTGIALGAGAALFVILPAIALGLAHYAWVANPDTSWRAALFTPLLLFCGAMGEEVVFRGYALQSLMRGYGAWVSIFVTGAIFGLLHGWNPGATPLGIVNTALFGVVFGAAILRTHDLWFPIGMHFGWNVILPFLGVELSGLTIRVTGYKLVWKAGDLWSGGEYGPEASVLTSLVLVILGLAVWKVPVHRAWAYFLDRPADEGEPLSQPSAS
ncbi:MAG: CPBP family intramembrane glutamic endopeptidase [Acidobacteriota bacterium]